MYVDEKFDCYVHMITYGCQNWFWFESLHTWPSISTKKIIFSEKMSKKTDIINLKKKRWKFQIRPNLCCLILHQTIWCKIWPIDCLHFSQLNSFVSISAILSLDVIYASNHSPTADPLRTKWYAIELDIFCIIELGI